MSKKKQKNNTESDSESKIVENKENIQKNSAQQSLSFTENKIIEPVEHIDEVKPGPAKDELSSDEKEETEEKTSGKFSARCRTYKLNK